MVIVISRYQIKIWNNEFFWEEGTLMGILSKIFCDQFRLTKKSFVFSAFLTISFFINLFYTSIAFSSQKFNQLANPSAEILNTRVIVHDNSYKKQWHYFQFKVPKAGASTLRLINGANTESYHSKRLTGIYVTLNGKTIKVSKNGKTIKVSKKFKFYNILKIPLSLQTGTNKLGIRLRGGTGKRLGLSISAIADTISISPVANSIEVGKNIIKSRAKLTALGLPVEGAKISFEIKGLGSIPKQITATDRSGIATVYFQNLTTPGMGWFKASAIERSPILFSQTPLKVVAKPSIKLLYDANKLSVNKGVSSNFKIRVNVKRNQKYRVNITHSIMPNSKGLKIQATIPPGGITGTYSKEFVISGKITGIVPGTYKVESIASIDGTDDKWKDTLLVEVKDPSAPEPLFVYKPSSKPVGIPPGKKEEVRFHVSVAGSSQPPKVLFLHKLDQNNELIFPPEAELYDNGENGDEQARDFRYTGNVGIISSIETSFDYKVRAEYFGKTIISKAYTFHITSVPIGVKPLDPNKLVTDPSNRLRIFSNLVVVGIKPEIQIKKDRIEEIVQSVNGVIVSHWPPLRLYSIEIEGDGTAVGVQRAIDIISTFSEVRYAVPSREVVPLAHSFNGIPPIDKAFPPCSANITYCQWYLQKINTFEGWKLAEGRSAIKVAILEPFGNVDYSHDELNGQGQQESSCSGSSCNMLHSTQVAGLIAAKINNSAGTDENPGMIGVAHHSSIHSYFAFGSPNIEIEIQKIAMTDAKIINLSFGAGDTPELLDAIEDSIDKEKIIVVASGQPLTDNQEQCPQSGPETDVWPAKYNTETNIDKGMIVVGATDEQDNLAEWEYELDINKRYCSNNAPWIDLYAPGRDIYSLKPGNTFGIGSGTSFSTALTSGVVAILWGMDLGVKNFQIHDQLILSGKEIETLGHCQDGESCRRLDLFNAVNQGEPTEINLSRRNINEGTDTTNGFSIGTLSTIDPNADEIHTYTINGGTDSAKFTIGGANDNELILTDGVLDFESKSSYSVSVQTTDRVGFNFTKTFTISVNDVNEVLRFDGINDFVRIPHNWMLNPNGFTIECWIFVEGGNDFIRRPIISKGEDFGSYTMSILGVQSNMKPGVVEYTHKLANDRNKCCSSESIIFGEWTHVAITAPNSRRGVRYYINGKRVSGDPTRRRRREENTGSLYFGRAFFNSISDQYHKGYLDEIRIWGFEKTPEMIANNYNKRISKPAEAPGLFGYWNFENQSNSQVVVDSSGNNNHGILGENINEGSDDPSRIIPPIPLPIN